MEKLHQNSMKYLTHIILNKSKLEKNNKQPIQSPT